MRIEPYIAFSLSLAFHAGLIAFVPASASRSISGPDPAAPPVIAARLKNTLADEEPPALQSESAPAAVSTAAEPAPEKEARVDNPQRFYPREAIEKGLEGEAIVMLRIGQDGELIDAQIAKSSGHAILDQAALRAVRAAPRFAAGPQEILFPVTFALH